MSIQEPTRSPDFPADSSIDDLDTAICRFARRMNADCCQFLLLLREFDDRYGWAKWSCASCAEWLAWRCGLSVSAAREHVRVAHALRKLPAISAAFAEGRVSYSKVRALTRAAHEHDEDLLLAYAVQATAAQVEERCRQIRNVAPESTDDAQRAWRRRSLSVLRDAAHGTLRIMLELPVEEGEVVTRAIERAVADGEVATGAELGEQSWHAQQADALVAVAKAYLSGVAGESTSSALPATSASSADHYQFVVHVDDKSLRGGVGRSDLPIETVRRLTCDGSLVTIVEDDEGAPLDVGRKRRTVSTALKRALWSRDRGCTFPGCRKTLYVDAHHIKHWADGGETSASNLTLLCTFHHRLLHEGGFAIRHDSAGSMYFQRPDGRVIPRCGYRLVDVLDDGVNPAEVIGTISEGLHVEGATERTSAERTSLEESSAEGTRAEAWWLATVVSGKNPSACMDSSSFARDLIFGGRLDCSRVSGLCVVPKARDHDGLFAR
jgi:hypothetical protein